MLFWPFVTKTHVDPGSADAYFLDDMRGQSFSGQALTGESVDNQPTGELSFASPTRTRTSHIPRPGRRAIRSDDPEFLNFVANIQENLEKQDDQWTVEDIAADLGFSQHDTDLLFEVTPEQNPALFRQQEELRKKYYEALKRTMCEDDESRQFFISMHYNSSRAQALTLAMFYFGVPAPPLPARQRASAAHDSLSFSDAYTPDQSARSMVERPAPPLAGGANTSVDPRPKPEMKSVYVSAFGKTCSVRTTSAFLYGRQGAVRFDLEDLSSFQDAVVRLMGATRAVHVILMKRAFVNRLERLTTHRQTFHEIINNSPTADPFCFDKIRYMILESRHGIESDDVDIGCVPFVFLEDEQPPKDHWRPNTEPVGLIKCIRRGSPTSSLRPNSGDVAYVGFTAPFKVVEDKWYTPRYRLYSNQYGPWFQVVARILTPGAGLTILKGKPGSLIANCRLGLVVDRFKEDSVFGSLYKPFSTHGGLGFLDQHTGLIANAVAAVGFVSNDDPENDYNDNEERYVEFEVDPLPEFGVGVFLAGLSSDETEAATAGVNTDEEEDGDDITKRSFRASLARCIDRVIEAGTTLDERKLIVGVDIWPDGYFWNSNDDNNGPIRPIRVHGPSCNPADLSDIDDHPQDAPSVVAIRPVFKTYTAHVLAPDKTEGSFEFTLDGSFKAFFASVVEAMGSSVFDAWQHTQGKSQDHSDYLEYKEYQELRGRAADIVDSRRELNHLWILQSWKDAATGNRPQFLVSRKTTTQAEWVRVCSQIVSPEIWVVREDRADWYEKDLATPSAWGYQAAYENLLSLDAHEKRWQVLYEKRMQSQLEPVPARDVEKGDTADSATSLSMCTFCSHQFSANDTDTDKLRHMVDQHNALRRADDTPAQLDVVVTQAPDDTGLATPPRQRTPPKKRTRSRTPSRLDPCYRPPKTRAKEESDASSSGEASGSSDKGTRAAGKKRKIAARRSTSNNDPTYRPEGDEDDEKDHDLGSAKFVPDDFGYEAGKKRRRTAPKINDPSYKPKEDSEDEKDHDLGSAKFIPDDFGGGPRGKKKKTAPKVNDPPFKPAKDKEDEDEDNDEDDKKKVTPSKKKLSDPSYHPGHDAGAVDVDDLDDALRQSAVPEYDRDPTDPAGKRLRVIREARGRTLRQRKEKEDTNSAVAVTIAKVALKGKVKGVSKAALKGKGKATTSSAASTPKRGRSRNAMPAVEG